MRKSQNAKETFLIFLRGLCMGLADVIPGVSGGTIAFITGIYNRLIHALSTVKISFLLHFLKGDIKKGIDGIKKIDWALFIPLGFGISLSLFFLSSFMSYMLEVYAGTTFAFFFGLIIASALVLYRKIAKANFERTVFLILGLLVGYVLSGASAIITNHSLLIIFISGIIAISAMLLPGISGAFLLLLLGQYEYMVNAIHQMHYTVTITFGIGALVGLLGFSKIIDILLRKAKSVTLFFLVGLMIGALRVPYVEMANSNQLTSLMILFGLLGFIVVFGMESVFGKGKH
jgi:putative membrane protein